MGYNILNLGQITADKLNVTAAYLFHGFMIS